MAIFGNSVASVTKKFQKLVAALEEVENRSLERVFHHRDQAAYHEAQAEAHAAEGAKARSVAAKIKELVS